MQDPDQPFSWPRFLVCFVSAPIVVTLLTFWLVIPIGALLVGGPLYWVVGLPVAALYLHFYPPDFGPMILLGQACQLLQIPMIFLVPDFVGSYPPKDIPLFLFFGGFFALVWTVAFLLLYRRSS